MHCSTSYFTFVLSSRLIVYSVLKSQTFPPCYTVQERRLFPKPLCIMHLYVRICVEGLARGSCRSRCHLHNRLTWRAAWNTSRHLAFVHLDDGKAYTCQRVEGEGKGEREGKERERGSGRQKEREQGARRIRSVETKEESETKTQRQIEKERQGGESRGRDRHTNINTHKQTQTQTKAQTLTESGKEYLRAARVLTSCSWCDSECDLTPFFCFQLRNAIEVANWMRCIKSPFWGLSTFVCDYIYSLSVPSPPCYPSYSHTHIHWHTQTYTLL